MNRRNAIARSRGIKLSVSALILSVLLFAAGCGTSGSPAVGTPAVPFTATDLNGNNISLTDYRGKVVLLDFWATWCGPCVGELPHVKRVYDTYKDSDFRVIGISLDSNRSDLESFIRMAGMEWPQIYDGKGWENEVSQLYNIYSIPSTFLLDRQGVIRYVNLRGPSELEEAVRELLGAAADQRQAPLSSGQM